ncbi:hypothetical protein QTJ16_004003 [Diplocarpon rosae]|uniref:Ribosomal RNA methyltransferase FtsJ domain-containing protein n=1 Tax=Diplocarpon rosae TaxID=946125 RepID=A0AAD9SYE7_9HELO|nr:hypothetical protein QTJ16_004003 [Diplocarpon rosae]
MDHNELFRRLATLKMNKDSSDYIGEDQAQEEYIADMLMKASIAEPRGIDNATKNVMEYILPRSYDFGICLKMRLRGWLENKEKGDNFFKSQREKADKTDEEGERRFYLMMQEIAEQMDRATGALKLQHSKSHTSKVLDICMAPGGYSAAIMRINPHSKLFGITLPVDLGGHRLCIDPKKLSGLLGMDITMLVREFTGEEAPRKHPDFYRFSNVQPFRFYEFDLVLCDGIKLRSHTRPSYREENEAVRLATSQLILAMQRIRRDGKGTLVMLLHKVESWSSVYTMYLISKFATIQTFKPLKKHQTRSSFYMIATNVDTQSEYAISAVKEWKKTWCTATFGGQLGTGSKPAEPTQELVAHVLTEFGGALIKYGQDIWFVKFPPDVFRALEAERIQAEALSMTDYAGNGNASAVPSTQAYTLSSPNHCDSPAETHENQRPATSPKGPSESLGIPVEKRTPGKELGNAWANRRVASEEYRKIVEAAGVDTSSWGKGKANISSGISKLPSQPQGPPGSRRRVYSMDKMTEEDEAWVKGYDDYSYKYTGRGPREPPPIPYSTKPQRDDPDTSEEVSRSRATSIGNIPSWRSGAIISPSADDPFVSQKSVVRK